MKWNSIY